MITRVSDGRVLARPAFNGRRFGRRTLVFGRRSAALAAQIVDSRALPLRLLGFARRGAVRPLDLVVDLGAMNRDRPRRLDPPLDGGAIDRDDAAACVGTR